MNQEHDLEVIPPDWLEEPAIILWRMTSYRPICPQFRPSLYRFLLLPSTLLTAVFQPFQQVTKNPA